jgi:DHA1 family tetracycline resistance protein-like MFS transporter
MVKRSGLALIVSTLFIDVAAMGMLIPVLPELLRGFVDGDFGRAAQLAGLIAALSAGLSFFCAPVLGALSDRVGRKPMLLLGMVGPAVTYFALAISPSIGWYVAGFCLSGVLGAILNTVNAYIADVTPYEERAARYGMVGAAFGLGFIVGPLAGGLLGGLGLQVPLLVAGAVTVLNLVLCVVLLPESLDRRKQRPFRWSQANPIASLGLLRRTPLLVALAAMLLLTNLANQGLYATWVFSTTMRFDWSITVVGIVFAVMGVCFALSQGLLVGPVVKRLGERRSILVGLTTSVAVFLGYALVPEGWMVLLVIVLGALGAVDEPATQALLSASVDETEQGAIQGAVASLLSITAIVGPLVSTGVFSYFTSASAPVVFPGAPLALGALLVLAALVVAWRFVKPAARPVAAVEPALALAV